MRPAHATRVSGAVAGRPHLDLYLWVGGEGPLDWWVVYQWEGHSGEICCSGSTPGGDVELGERHAIRVLTDYDGTLYPPCSHCGSRMTDDTGDHCAGCGTERHQCPECGDGLPMGEDRQPLACTGCGDIVCTRCGDELPPSRAVGPGAAVCESCEGELEDVDSSRAHARGDDR